MSRKTRRFAGAAVAGACGLALAAPALAAPAPAASPSAAATVASSATPAKAATAKPGAAKAASPRNVDVQILSFNDLHGNLEPPTGSSGRIQVGPTSTETADAGGVEYLATHLKQARAGHRNTVTVAAGDMVGASPLLSAAFHDEPTVDSLNSLGLDITAVGNHEFDEGYTELQRLQKGGCIDDGDGANNQNSCPDGAFEGADFQYLAANVVEKSTGKTILPSYAIKNFGNGVRIGFIGMTLKDTANIVTASGVAGLEFKDEVQTANKLVPVLKAKGVNAIVVLIHQGGTPPSGTPYYYTCQGGGQLDATSPIIPIAQKLSPAIDMVVSGHTHQPYVCNIPDPSGRDRLVTSASSFGRLYTETNLKYDTQRNDIARTSVQGSNMVVTRVVPKDAAQTELINRFKALVTPIASRVLGQITTDIVRAQNAAGESPLGDMIADAQLADDSTVKDGKVPVVAFMNPGGVRADLVYNSQKYPGENPGDVTFEEAFTVQPFNNYLVSMDLTGQEIYDVLNQQVTGANAASNKILAVSDGFTYSWTKTGTPGVVDGSVAIDGVPVDKSATYRISTNNFLSDGGDGFAAFQGGDDKFFGGLDIDAFADYLEANSPYSPQPLDRITLVP
ncbi:bifunctional metallophosphatase/5'-nucleotidase [Terracoccus luteus]|uniref:5'-nucleotidase n=1 Tax=Terracoccus luteus TaxID=53356 RepID=A0A839PRC8_9MICO|nr:bifunctional metallophosphatase/5'-nucleotidase [Terracoccus luteus]MBB2986740.1 5'-nucleotidase [Terracoccus luteus]MCP2172391.1 5'-nucleotidase [Terracoccus luteus]